MEPKIVHRSAFTIVGYGIKSNSTSGTKDCPALWDKFETEGWEQKLYSQLSYTKHGEYGICYKENNETDEFVYIIGLEVKDLNNIDPDMVTADIPPADYVVFTTPPADDHDFVRTIHHTWDYIMNEWFPESGYSWDETKPDFEFYDERCHGLTNKVMEIYVPIIKNK